MMAWIGIAVVFWLLSYDPLERVDWDERDDR